MNEKIDYQSVVDDVINQLIENNDWEKRFAGYADAIEENGKEYVRKRKWFHVAAPLYAYTSVSKVKKNSCAYDLRFRGQSVATISVDKDDKVYISDRDKKNEKYFGCKHQLNRKLWDSVDARDFRKYFRDLAGQIKTKSEEHVHENMLLSHLKKSTSTDKKILNIQPVQLCKNFFQMPTAVCASDKNGEIKYGGKSGGGIDILARVGKGRALAVIELKDENNASEGPEIAIKQAVAYATFIHQLLRSESGDQWWKHFGFTGKVPDVLTIYAVVAMPGIDKKPDFVGIKLGLPVVDKIVLYHMTYSVKNNELVEIKTSIPEVCENNNP